MDHKTTTLLVALAGAFACAESTHAGDGGEPKQPQPTAAAACTCYCLAAWAAPIAAPYVPNLPNKVSGGFWNGTQTETETGDEFWTASVNQKTYTCGTATVTATTGLNLNLVHNTYTRNRSRTGTWRWGWPPFVWGAWTAWSAYLSTGNLNDRAALMTSAPPSTPWCTDTGVACP